MYPISSGSLIERKSLPTLTINAKTIRTSERTKVFKKHVKIRFSGLYHPRSLGVCVDELDVPKQQIQADQSCILHTFYRSESNGITIFTRHFSTFRLYCKKHKKKSTYEACLNAVLFSRQQHAEDIMSVNVKVVLDMLNSNRTVSTQFD